MRTLLLTVVAVLASQAAVACQCGVRTPPEELAWAPMVFAGRVLEVRDLFTPSRRASAWLRIRWAKITAQYREPVFDASYWGFAVTFEVRQAWKGKPPQRVTLVTGRSGITERAGDCGYPFRKGGSYLVFSQPRVAGFGQDVSECTRTAPLENAAPDVQFLNAVAGPPN